MPLQHSPTPKRKNQNQPLGSLVSAASNLNEAGAPHSSATLPASEISKAINLEATQPVHELDSASGKADGGTAVKFVGAARVSSCGKKGRDIKRLDSDVYKPWGTRSRSNSETRSDQEEESVICRGGPGKMTCGEEVKDGEPGVQCEACFRWFHADCQSVPKAAITALNKFKMLSWFCAACKLAITKVINADEVSSSQLTQIEAKVDRLENAVKQTLQEIHAEVARHAETTDMQTKQVEQAIQAVELQKNTYAQAVKGTCSDMVKQVTARIEAIPKPVQQKYGINTAEEISGVFDNFLDREKRKLNLVVHNLEESSGDSYTEIVQQDTQKFVDMVKKGLKINARVTKAFRVGKKLPTKHRLLIVSMENMGVKTDILKMAYCLRQTTDYSNIYISPDLTWKEREEGKKLRAELARRREAGETNLVIRRGKITQLQTKDQVTGSAPKPDEDSGPALETGGLEAASGSGRASRPRGASVREGTQQRVFGSAAEGSTGKTSSTHIAAEAGQKESKETPKA